jgi:hypothetical protein
MSKMGALKKRAADDVKPGDVVQEALNQYLGLKRKK